jgi:hypothetical protein
MSLGRTPSQSNLFGASTQYCEDRLSPTSIHRLLHREGGRLFPDGAFADLFQDVGRCSVPPRIVATVMVLQRLEGLSDREAVDRFSFDLRWKYACGGLDYEYPGFVHTVLVDMRARLRKSERPDRIFESALEVAREAGLVGRKRVLDSTALYDAVATQDTVTLVRSAIRALLAAAGEDLARQMRSVLKRDDDYAARGKPTCDWDDAPAREALVDALAKDAQAVLGCLEGRKPGPEVAQAAQLVATVVGQDLALGQDGIFRIIRGVAPDRVISTVDTEARHGHKTEARAFDGYKGHISIDPDSEIITATQVTPGNAADGSVAKSLLSEALAPAESAPAAVDEKVEVYGDSSYGTAEVIEHIEQAGGEANVKAQAPSPPPGGKFAKDQFCVDLAARTVTCPAGKLVQIRHFRQGETSTVEFGTQCWSCPLRAQCTDSPKGRTIRIHAHEDTLQRTRQRQSKPAWKARYKATRPKVERKFAQLMFRRHGGRRARVRGCQRVGQDFALLGAAVNLRRMAILGIRFAGEWTC